MIECSLRDFKEFHSVISNYNSKKIKKGFYSNSIIPVEGLGKDKWLVVTHVNVDYEKYINEGLTEREVYEQCVDFLNQPPPRKKYAKKKPKPLYGHLTPYKAKFKKDESGSYIEAEFTTDQRKNKNFWREGPKFGKVKLPSKLRGK
tara:strand:- start:259 stop:696 length:438 start_codon:yes stop_codon:yes gene_type:complete